MQSMCMHRSGSYRQFQLSLHKSDPDSTYLGREQDEIRSVNKKANILCF